jgi:hypothetical protein
MYQKKKTKFFCDGVDRGRPIGKIKSVTSNEPQKSRAIMAKLQRKIHLTDNSGRIQCSRTRNNQGMTAGAMVLDRFNEYEDSRQCKECKKVADRWNASRDQDSVSIEK